MKTKIISILMAMTVVAIFSLPSSAQASDFSICDGLEGAASGLCVAGVAIGCDVDNTQSGCIQIERQF